MITRIQCQAVYKQQTPKKDLEGYWIEDKNGKTVLEETEHKCQGIAKWDIDGSMLCEICMIQFVNLKIKKDGE